MFPPHGEVVREKKKNHMGGGAITPSECPILVFCLQDSLEQSHEMVALAWNIQQTGIARHEYPVRASWL